MLLLFTGQQKTTHGQCEHPDDVVTLLHHKTMPCASGVTSMPKCFSQNNSERRLERAYYYSVLFLSMTVDSCGNNLVHYAIH